MADWGGNIDVDADKLVNSQLCSNSKKTIKFGVKRSTAKVTAQSSLHLASNWFLHGNSCLD